MQALRTGWCAWGGMVAVQNSILIYIWNASESRGGPRRVHEQVSIHLGLVRPGHCLSRNFEIFLP